MLSPTVSVVMVIRDVEQFLGESIESILRQTFRDFEFIIVDFGSKDRSKKIAADYASQDRRIRLSQIPACSYIEAKISACALPRGQFIAIQDADDVSLPDRLELEADFLREHPRVGLVGGAVQWIDCHGRRMEGPCNPPTEDKELRRVLKERNPFWHPTVLLRRDAYIKAGGYRPAFTQSDDYDLWLRLTEQYECANLDRVVLCYRIHPNQLSLRKKREQVLCALASQAAAALRAEGRPDPLDRVEVITPALLAEMGVSRTRQQVTIAEAYRYWSEQLYSAGEYAAVVGACKELLLECGRDDVGSRAIARAHLLSAKANWKLGCRMRSWLSMAEAIRVYPQILGRLFRIFV